MKNSNQVQIELEETANQNQSSIQYLSLSKILNERLYDDQGNLSKEYIPDFPLEVY